ncbi:MAG: hypothetical protein MZV70_46995 [Desulfobacterales bacterium]|nr:hypothetical protein [Desulfobacterales bacterium]
MTRVHYDLDGNKALSYDIANAGGAELDAIRRGLFGALVGRPGVVIVRTMKSYYYLSAAVSDTDTTITVTAPSVFNYDPNYPVSLGTGATEETVHVTGSAVSYHYHPARGTPAWRPRRGGPGIPCRRLGQRADHHHRGQCGPGRHQMDGAP